ncbi:MAG: T9SS type A sorting domain-containing protein [Bacteroidetes bacterium]|jgi:hypothetical protein|nr:T9SS type A sorting domain-containing protein [Bacteroidota bacterium]
MKCQLKIAITFFFLGSGFLSLHAQKAMPAAGGHATGNSGSASYSVGQCVYQTFTGPKYWLAEGIQQPYEISVISSVEDNLIPPSSISAYPNPVTEQLILEVGYPESPTLTVQLFDIHGTLLQSENITGSRARVPMAKLAAGTYFVKVVKDGSINSKQKVKTFKILKK